MRLRDAARLCRAAASVGGFGGRSEPPMTVALSSRHGGGAQLAEAYGEERVKQRGGGDQRGVGPLAQQVIGALDGGDAADGEDRAIPGASLPPRQHLLD